MVDIDHLSYSSISSYMTCGKAWKYKYVDKLPTIPSETLVIGSCVHDVVEEQIRAASIGEEPTDISVFASRIVSKRFEGMDPINNTLNQENVLEEVLRITEAPLVKSGIEMIRAKVDPDGEPMIERKVELTVPEVDVPIIGYIDIILSDGTPADFKTASRSWTQEKAESELQPVFYLAAMGQNGLPVNWKFKHLVMVKNKNPKFQMFEHVHKPDELFRLFEKIQTVWRSIQQDVFLPAAPGSWKCSPKFCDYYDICQKS